MMPGVVLGVLLAAPPVTLVFGGDVIPHQAVKAAALAHSRTGADGGIVEVDGWVHVLGALGPVFHGADVAVVNLETPITPGPGRTREMLFNAPPALAAGLARVGVTVASFANNHCLDQWPEGIVATRAALADAGVLAVGAGVTEADAWRPLVVEVRGVRLALVAVSRWLNGFENRADAGAPHVPVVPYRTTPIRGGRSEAAVAELVASLQGTVDGVIVLVHWGAEYLPGPAPEDRRFARALVAAGALAVIGHHPHVVQPVEWMGRPDGGVAPVAFSLGNLVSNQESRNELGRTRDGLLLELGVEPAPGGARVASLTGIPVATENRPGPRPDVQVVLLADELSAIEDRLALLARRPRAEVTRERSRLSARRTVALRKLGRITSLLPSVGPTGVVTADPRDAPPTIGVCGP